MFDPSSKLMDLRGKKYLQVPWRLVWLNDDYSRGLIGGFSIDTAQVFDREFDNPKATSGQDACAKFRTTVKILDSHGNVIKSATGTGTAYKSEFSLYTEKAETKSVGRALAMVGYGTAHCEDDFDMGEEASPVDGLPGPALADAPLPIGATASSSAEPPPGSGLPQRRHNPPSPPQTTAPPGVPQGDSAPLAREGILRWLEERQHDSGVREMLGEAARRYRDSVGGRVAADEPIPVSELPEEALASIYLKSAGAKQAL